MDFDKLLELWRQPESEWVEWKPSLSQSESIYKTICAFSNDYAAHQRDCVIFIGRKDDGSCSNLRVVEQDMLEFVDRTRDSGNILPLPKLSYQQVTLDGCSVVALIVSPSTSTLTLVQKRSDVLPIRRAPVG